MQLKYCSITGADNAVEIGNLDALAAQFPFVEWAILLLPSEEGNSRCPTTDWIENFSAHSACRNKAMHLCGDALLQFIANDKSVLSLMHGFQRIQLNLKFGNVEGRYDPAELLARMREKPEWQFILQYTPDKKDLLPLLHDIPNHAILFDASAGRGINPDSWDAPLPDHFCGYAGGLNPGNLAKNLENISRVATGALTWIDMESGVRTNDIFDLEKVHQVLEIAKPYALRHAERNPA